MKPKPNIIKKVISGIAVSIFIIIAIALLTIGNNGFDNIDIVYNMAFGAIVIIFILYRVIQTTKVNSPIRTKKKGGSPPRLDNKPLHPK